MTAPTAPIPSTPPTSPVHVDILESDPTSPTSPPHVDIEPPSEPLSEPTPSGARQVGGHQVGDGYESRPDESSRDEPIAIGGEDVAVVAVEAEVTKPSVTGASEPGYIAPTIFETATHPQEMVDRMHSLLDGLEASAGPADVIRVRELRTILNHLGATTSTG